MLKPAETCYRVLACTSGATAAAVFLRLCFHQCTHGSSQTNHCCVAASGSVQASPVIASAGFADELGMGTQILEQLVMSQVIAGTDAATAVNITLCPNLAAAAAATASAVVAVTALSPPAAAKAAQSVAALGRVIFVPLPQRLVLLQVATLAKAVPQWHGVCVRNTDDNVMDTDLKTQAHATETANQEKMLEQSSLL